MRFGVRLRPEFLLISGCRHLVDTEDSLFGMTLAGDIVEWDRSSKAGSVQQIYKSKRAADKVDAFEYSTAKDTLVVGYLGGVKVTGEKGIPKPPSQITLFKRETTSRVSSVPGLGRRRC